jgi:hypothetical protein
MRTSGRGPGAGRPDAFARQVRARRVAAELRACACASACVYAFGLASALVLSVAAGCAHHLPAVRSYPAPAAGELVARLRARQGAFRSMNARVRATSWLGGDRVRATVLMLVERGGKLRFEAEVSLQGTVAVLATDGRRFGLLDVAHNELRRGPACARNVAELIRIPLGPADVAALLLGDVALPTGPVGDVAASPAAWVDWDAERGGDVLVLPSPGGWLRVVFAALPAPAGGRVGSPGDEPIAPRAPPPPPVLAVVATSAGGTVRWRARFDDFVAPTFRPGTAPAGPAVMVPRTIEYAEGTSSFDEGVEIKFKDRVFDEETDPAAFVLEPAAGVKTVEVGCP